MGKLTNYLSILYCILVLCFNFSINLDDFSLIMCWIFHVPTIFIFFHFFILYLLVKIVSVLVLTVACLLAGWTRARQQQSSPAYRRVMDLIRTPHRRRRHTLRPRFTTRRPSSTPPPRHQSKFQLFLWILSSVFFVDSLISLVHMASLIVYLIQTFFILIFFRYYSAPPSYWHY